MKGLKVLLHFGCYINYKDVGQIQNRA